MIETPAFQQLLEENRQALVKHALRHDLTKPREIEITSRYKDWDTAQSARKHIKEKYEIPQSVSFYVRSFKYSDDDITIELAFSLKTIPQVEEITQYEFMLLDAAEKFGGETPGWEIEAT
jgi:hypothetical protein